MSLISASAQTDRIVSRVEPSLTAMGCHIVRVAFLTGPRRTLQIIVDRADGASVSVDDCTRVSHTVSALLDVDEVVRGAYDLEVSSPGIDRPLTRTRDFERFAGQLARIEVSSPIDGRKRFRGCLQGMSDETVRIAVDEKEYAIPLAQIEKAKLVLTDELVAAATSLEN